MYVSANTVYKYGDSLTTPAGVAPPIYVHHLAPVSPNPATGKVRISFDIKEHTTNVLLEVANIDSRTSYKVASGYLAPGHYEYTWDGRNSPAGNYIVWLGTDEIPMVEKFVLVHRD